MKAFWQKHERKIQILAPTVFGILYIVLCAVNLRQSVWFDESYGAYLTRFDPGQIWSMTTADVHPPLYYFLLKLWSGIFGSTDFGMRFMSVFFGAIAIVFAWQWLKRKFGVKPALLATFLMTVSPMLIRYGQEMRMYTMAAAIIFGSTYVLQLAVDTKKRKYWIIYGVLMALGMWTHYFTALIFLAHLAYLIYVYRKKIFQKNIIMSYVLAVVLYIPWLPAFLAQSNEVQKGFWIAAPNMTTVTDYATMSFLYRNSTDTTGWLLVFMLVLLGCLIFLVRKLDRKAMVLKLMAFVPPVLLLLVSMPPFTPMFVDRYTIYSMICLALIVGIGIMTIKFRRKIVPVLLAVVFIGASVVGVVNVYSVGNFNFVTNSRSDAKSLFEYVVLNSEVGQPIISNSEWLYYDLAFYGTEEHPVYFVDELVTYEWGSHRPLQWYSLGKITDLDAFLEEHEIVWFVGSLPKKGDLEFPREGFRTLQNMILDVNINQAPYQALQLSRTADVDYVIDYRL
ncbi:glycosyltransferase family 39 protein [Candidatus Saccharibacteria bacterium]|nr:glycosyltransferase family 39 protein [Candidatus Saccharibacteria bacterium]